MKKNYVESLIYFELLNLFETKVSEIEKNLDTKEASLDLIQTQNEKDDIEIAFHQAFFTLKHLLGEDNLDVNSLEDPLETSLANLELKIKNSNSLVESSFDF